MKNKDQCTVHQYRIQIQINVKDINTNILFVHQLLKQQYFKTPGGVHGASEEPVKQRTFLFKQHPRHIFMIHITTYKYEYSMFHWPLLGLL